jgi:hypothetical protein
VRTASIVMVITRHPTIMIEAAHASETSVYFYETRLRYTPEDIVTRLPREPEISRMRSVRLFVLFNYDGSSSDYMALNKTISNN